LIELLDLLIFFHDQSHGILVLLPGLSERRSVVVSIFFIIVGEGELLSNLLFEFMQGEVGLFVVPLSGCEVGLFGVGFECDEFVLHLLDGIKVLLSRFCRDFVYLIEDTGQFLDAVRNLLDEGFDEHAKIINLNQTAVIPITSSSKKAKGIKVA
jgi:hypothetical protein